MTSSVELVDVTAENWADVADVEPHEFPREFVAPIARYLCMAHYERAWRPWAVIHHGSVVGHVIGRRAMTTVIERLRRDEDAVIFSLDYRSENERARSLYRSLGFVETGETDGDEVVARLR